MVLGNTNLGQECCTLSDLFGNVFCEDTLNQYSQSLGPGLNSQLFRLLVNLDVTRSFIGLGLLQNPCPELIVRIVAAIYKWILIFILVISSRASNRHFSQSIFESLLPCLNCFSRGIDSPFIFAKLGLWCSEFSSLSSDFGNRLLIITSITCPIHRTISIIFIGSTILITISTPICFSFSSLFATLLSIRSRPWGSARRRLYDEGCKFTLVDLSAFSTCLTLPQDMLIFDHQHSFRVLAFST